jgi:hypothetical protein
VGGSNRVSADAFRDMEDSQIDSDLTPDHYLFLYPLFERRAYNCLAAGEISHPVHDDEGYHLRALMVFRLKIPDGRLLVRWVVDRLVWA